MILSKEQIMIRDMARDFAQERLVPNAAEWDKSSKFPAEELKEMGELGLYGMKKKIDGALVEGAVIREDGEDKFIPLKELPEEIVSQIS